MASDPRDLEMVITRAMISTSPAVSSKAIADAVQAFLNAQKGRVEGRSKLWKRAAKLFRELYREEFRQRLDDHCDRAERLYQRLRAENLRLTAALQSIEEVALRSDINPVDAGLKCAEIARAAREHS